MFLATVPAMHSCERCRMTKGLTKMSWALRGAMAAMTISAVPLAPAAAQEVTIHGLSEGMAVASMAKGKPKVLRPGDSLAEGIKLVKSGPASATFLVNGEKKTFNMGHNISVATTGSGATQVTLTSDTSGHFIAEGSINGGSIRFLVDTGATTIFLSAADARRLGINYLKGRPGFSETAGGTIRIYWVKLDTVKIGEVSASNVDAVVSEQEQMPFALLGMSFLNRMRMDRDGDRLTLTKRF
ncbi:MAG: TIGR02281 family clan AA aspartic protease [Betaproteobacteria bacterium]|nr:TIGR02281 family clan AA aspartic protease [Betaproteobacteria bacterium]